MTTPKIIPDHLLPPGMAVRREYGKWVIYVKSNGSSAIYPITEIMERFEAAGGIEQAEKLLRRLAKK